MIFIHTHSGFDFFGIHLSKDATTCGSSPTRFSPSPQPEGSGKGSQYATKILQPAKHYPTYYPKERNMFIPAAFRFLRTSMILCVLIAKSHSYGEVWFMYPCVGDDITCSKDEGRSLDYCLLYGKKCGWCAAYDYCRSKGFKRTTGYSSSSVPSATTCAGDQKKCRGDFCDGFFYIKCKDRSGLLYDGTSNTHTYYYPEFRSMPLDWCLIWEDECGKYPADAYCRMRGFKTALDYRKRALPMSSGPTRTRCIGDSRVCDKRYHNGGCDTFEFIKCGK